MFALKEIRRYRIAFGIVLIVGALMTVGLIKYVFSHAVPVTVLAADQVKEYISELCRVGEVPWCIR